jgi:hypothetical protein
VTGARANQSSKAIQAEESNELDLVKKAAAALLRKSMGYLIFARLSLAVGLVGYTTGRTHQLQPVPGEASFLTEANAVVCTVADSLTGTAKKEREAKLAKAFDVLVLTKEIFDHRLCNIFSSLSIIIWY